MKMVRFWYIAADDLDFQGLMTPKQITFLYNLFVDCYESLFVWIFFSVSFSCRLDTLWVNFMRLQQFFTNWKI